VAGCVFRLKKHWQPGGERTCPAARLWPCPCYRVRLLRLVWVSDWHYVERL